MNAPAELHNHTVSTAEALSIGWQHFRNGDLDRSGRVCDAIFRVLPFEPGAVELMIEVLIGRQQSDQALALTTDLVSQRPDLAALHYLHGKLLHRLGDVAAALASLNRANALGFGVDALRLAADICRDLGDDTQALDLFDRALSLAPDAPDLLSNRGTLLKKLGRMDESLDAQHAALRALPGSIDIQINLANTYQAMGRNQEALEVFDRVIELEPASVLARKGRAVSLMRLSRPAAAARAFEWLAHRGVRDPSVLTAYSLCLGDAGRHPEALRMIERALSYAPEDPGLKLQRSLLLLTFGRYADALPLYEYRHQSAFFNEAERRVFTEGPRWTGDESPAGRRILLRAEQGLGDSFHFVRYAIELERRGAAVIVQVPADLVGFFSESLPRLRFIARGEALPEYDLHCPLMSLPLAFLRMDHTMQFFSSAEAYLRASPERMAEWSSRLSSHGSGPRVGITWQGRRTHRTDAARSIPLAQMLDALPAGIQYVCLQNELTDSERELLAHRSDILSFTDQLTDWSQTAALCAQMDRIVSIDTSVAHLGAALGRPVDLLLSRAPDWRWQLTGSSTDWYPTMTLHRQASLGDWSVPLAELRRALSSLARCD